MNSISNPCEKEVTFRHKLAGFYWNSAVAVIRATAQFNRNLTANASSLWSCKVSIDVSSRVVGALLMSHRHLFELCRAKKSV